MAGKERPSYDEAVTKLRYSFESLRESKEKLEVMQRAEARGLVDFFKKLDGDSELRGAVNNISDFEKFPEVFADSDHQTFKTLGYTLSDCTNKDTKVLAFTGAGVRIIHIVKGDDYDEESDRLTEQPKQKKYLYVRKESYSQHIILELIKEGKISREKVESRTADFMLRVAEYNMQQQAAIQSEIAIYGGVVGDEENS